MKKFPISLRTLKFVGALALVASGLSGCSHGPPATKADELQAFKGDSNKVAEGEAKAKAAANSQPTK